jgi:hypothetical protein
MSFVAIAALSILATVIPANSGSSCESQYDRYTDTTATHCY